MNNFFGKYGVYFLALLAMLFWGASFVWYKQAVIFYGPLTIVFFRLLISTLLLLLTTHKVKSDIHKGDGKLFILLGLFEPFFYFLGESFGLLYLSATVGAIIISTIPLLTPIFSYFFLHERVTKLGLVGLFVSFAGVILVVTENYEGFVTFKGVLLMMFAVLSAIGYGIVVRKLADRYSVFTIVKKQNYVGMLLFFPLFLGFEGKTFLTVQPQMEAIIPIIFLAVFASTLAFIFNTLIIRKLGLINATVFANLIPVFTAIISYFLLKEAFGVQKITGIVIVIFGLFVSQIPLIRNRSKL